jgi:hypothetical protein
MCEGFEKPGEGRCCIDPDTVTRILKIIFVRIKGAVLEIKVADECGDVGGLLDY